jgi:hypothetical protein
MPVTIDKLLGKPLSHSHQISDIIGLNDPDVDAITFATVTASSTTLSSAANMILANAVSNAITVNLPAASTRTNLVYRIKKTDASTNRVTIVPNGSETIDGSQNLILQFQNSAVDIVSSGTSWYII